MRLAIILSTMFFITTPSISHSSPYSEKNTEKEHWFYAPWTYASQQFEDWVVDAIDNAFEDSMYQILGEAIGQKFGEAVAEKLSGFISIGPFLSVTDLLGLGQSNTESQIMLQILLEAIENAKEDIINSVELQFQDETEARLNTIIRDLDLYNARSTPARMTAYTTLSDLISHSNYVLSRIEQKSDKYADNLHRYITLAALQIQMQKEYTRWLMLTSDPLMTETDIENETMAVLTTQISQIDNFITNSPVGTIAFWQSTFQEEFSNRSTIDFIGRIPENDIPFIEGVSNKLVRVGVGRNSRLEVVNLIDPRYSGYYSYKMGTGTVEFMILSIGCEIVQGKPAFISKAEFLVIDTAGEVAGGPSHRANGRCTDARMLSYTSLPANLISTPGLQAAINNHMNDEAAFRKYLSEGYQPIREVIIQWREMANMPEKAASEIDTYIDTAS